MMNMPTLAASAVIGYALGAIPFGYVLVRMFRHADVRTTGSGNIGATNVARTSLLLGVATLILDAAKGLAAVLLVQMVFRSDLLPAFTAAFAAVIGHMFPVWLGFRGGKGVATGLGSFVLLTPKAVLVAIGIFLALAAVFRFVSLASITAAALLPLLAVLLTEVRDPVEIGLMSAASLLIIIKHHQNIRRLLSRTEPKFNARST
jgi:acyl phosphate:glycerol-3-phosphate acyltransferase